MITLHPLAAGVDVGGTKTEAVLIDDVGAVVSRARVRTVLGETGVVASIVDAVTAAAAATGSAPSAVTTVGIGIPGAVDPSTGVVGSAVNLGIADFALGARVERLLEAAVRVDNDVNLAALGAAGSLSLSPQSSLAYLNLGTGMGAGIVLGGKIYRGRSGAAGEIGHLPFDVSGPPCGCGMTGCLELYASGSGLERASGSARVEALFSDAVAGDSGASAIVARFCAALVTAIRTLVQSYDVDTIALGGGVMASAAHFLPLVHEILGAQSERSRFQRSLSIADRLVALDAADPVAAIGGALWGSSFD